MKKRLLSLFLALAMVLTMVPMDLKAEASTAPTTPYIGWSMLKDDGTPADIKNQYDNAKGAVTDIWMYFVDATGYHSLTRDQLTVEQNPITPDTEVIRLTQANNNALHVEMMGWGTATVKYTHTDNTVYTMNVVSDIRDYGYYTSPTASRETYITEYTVTGTVGNVVGEFYFVAKNSGATVDDWRATQALQDIANVEKNTDGTYYKITVNQEPQGGVDYGFDWISNGANVGNDYITLYDGVDNGNGNIGVGGTVTYGDAATGKFSIGYSNGEYTITKTGDVDFDPQMNYWLAVYDNSTGEWMGELSIDAAKPSSTDTQWTFNESELSSMGTTIPNSGLYKLALAVYPSEPTLRYAMGEGIHVNAIACSTPPSSGLVSGIPDVVYDNGDHTMSIDTSSLIGWTQINWGLAVINGGNPTDLDNTNNKCFTLSNNGQEITLHGAGIASQIPGRTGFVLYVQVLDANNVVLYTDSFDLVLGTQQNPNLTYADTIQNGMSVSLSNGVYTIMAAQGGTISIDRSNTGVSLSIYDETSGDWINDLDVKDYTIANDGSSMTIQASDLGVSGPMDTVSAGTYKMALSLFIQNGTPEPLVNRYGIGSAHVDALTNPNTVYGTDWAVGTSFETEYVHPLGESADVIIGVDVAFSQGDVITYQWYCDGKAIQGATDREYQVENLVSDATYYCIVTNSTKNENLQSVNFTFSFKQMINVQINADFGEFIYSMHGPVEGTTHFGTGVAVGGSLAGNGFVMVQDPVWPGQQRDLKHWTLRGEKNGEMFEIQTGMTTADMLAYVVTDEYDPIIFEAQWSGDREDYGSHIEFDCFGGQFTINDNINDTSGDGIRTQPNWGSFVLNGNSIASQIPHFAVIANPTMTDHNFEGWLEYSEEDGVMTLLSVNSDGAYTVYTNTTDLLTRVVPSHNVRYVAKWAEINIDQYPGMGGNGGNPGGTSVGLEWMGTIPNVFVDTEEVILGINAHGLDNRSYSVTVQVGVGDDHGFVDLGNATYEMLMNSVGVLNGVKLFGDEIKTAAANAGFDVDGGGISLEVRVQVSVDGENEPAEMGTNIDMRFSGVHYEYRMDYQDMVGLCDHIPPIMPVEIVDAQNPYGIREEVDVTNVSIQILDGADDAFVLLAIPAEDGGGWQIDFKREGVARVTVEYEVYGQSGKTESYSYLIESVGEMWGVDWIAGDNQHGLLTGEKTTLTAAPIRWIPTADGQGMEPSDDISGGKIVWELPTIQGVTFNTMGNDLTITVGANAEHQMFEVYAGVIAVDANGNPVLDDNGDYIVLAVMMKEYEITDVYYVVKPESLGEPFDWYTTKVITPEVFRVSNDANGNKQETKLTNNVYIKLWYMSYVFDIMDDDGNHGTPDNPSDPQDPSTYLIVPAGEPIHIERVGMDGHEILFEAFEDNDGVQNHFPLDNSMWVVDSITVEATIMADKDGNGAKEETEVITLEVGEKIELAANVTPSYVLDHLDHQFETYEDRQNISAEEAVISLNDGEITALRPGVSSVFLMLEGWGDMVECMVIVNRPISAETSGTTTAPDTSKPVDKVSVVEDPETEADVKEEVIKVIEKLAVGDENLDQVISPETQEKLAEALVNGDEIEAHIVLNPMTDSDVAKLPAEEKKALKEQAEEIVGKSAKVVYLDVSVMLYNKTSSEEIGNVKELDEAIVVTIAVPENLKGKIESGKVKVLRYHDGVAEALTTWVNADGTISFSTSKFSTYTLVYEEPVEAPSGPVGGTPAPQPQAPSQSAPQGTQSAPTGDTAPVMLYMALVMAAVVLMAVAETKRRALRR